MSQQLPDDTLRKILVQIQQRAVQSQKALTITKNQSSAKERERRVLQLTMEEVKSLDADVNLYKGVGKMFVMTPHPVMLKELGAKDKEVSDDISSLDKKAKYLEKQFNEAQGQLRDIFHSAQNN